MTDSLKQDAYMNSWVHEERSALIENAVDAVIGTDSNSLICDVNAAAEEMFGLSRQVLLGRPLAAFLHESDIERESTRREARVMTPDATSIPVEVTAVVLGSAANKIQYRFLRDLRALKNHEAELLEALRVRDEFLSVASHELKTPLTPMKLQLQTLALAIETGRAETISVPRLEKLIDNSCRQLDRLIHLVDDLLDYSRINTGRLRLSLEKIELSEFVTEICERYAPQAKSAGCAIELCIQPDVEAELDPRRLEQVISNLLANAFRYAPATAVRIELCGTAEQIFFKMTDGGPGIQIGDRQRIFDRFEQVKDERVVGGLGLGLYICRQIVEAHGGEIWVENGTPSGARFVMRLPGIDF